MAHVVFFRRCLRRAARRVSVDGRIQRWILALDLDAVDRPRFLPRYDPLINIAQNLLRFAFERIPVAAPTRHAHVKNIIAAEIKFTVWQESALAAELIELVRCLIRGDGFFDAGAFE